MADEMTPEQHYDAGIAELAEPGDKDMSGEARLARAGRAQAHFLAGILAAVLADQRDQREAAGGP